MDSDVVIRAEGLGKKYLIGHQAQQERYVALRDVIARSVSRFARTAGDMLRGRQLVEGDEIEEFWALKDVNFEIKRGDVVGIIGRNGAGKSTLLKILSRITEPSEGRVEIRGRVASLLEVGTGFHPELTGRENIYLNGAILGMTHAEIRRKFNEIVAFAEIEKFLDTPVKRYSSGMYVRLAFAVAAHLEPEILVVDEVLAVGDAEFQNKCLGKMQDVAAHGRTVLFVSHNLATIAALCPRSVYLTNGQIRNDGPTKQIVSAYQNDATGMATGRHIVRRGPCELFVNARSVVQHPIDGSITITITVSLCCQTAKRVALNFFFHDDSANSLGACSLGGLGSLSPLSIDPSTREHSFLISLPRLAQGIYHCDVEIAGMEKSRIALFERVISFESAPPVEADCSEVLRQSWGFGPLWPEVRLV